MSPVRSRPWPPNTIEIGENSDFFFFIESRIKPIPIADYGKGKPLTVRRIMAVKAAIDADGSAKVRSVREMFGPQ